MILVTLGTQDKSFKRLLEKIDEEIKKGHIKDEVIVQAGHTKYESTNMKIFDFIDRDEFSNLIKKCDILLTHGGVGSILTGLSNNKKVIATPRLARFQEHINDHQLEIIKNFGEKGYVIPLINLDDLSKSLKAAKKFVPNNYESNTKNMIKIIADFIDNN